MKVGIVGAGKVGAATALSLIERGGMCREIALVDRESERAAGSPPICATPRRCHRRCT